MTDNRPALERESRRSILPGVGVMTIGVLALGIALVEYVLFGEITKPVGGDGKLLGMSPGTAAYVIGYGGAGVVLIALGLLKVRRARRAR